MKPAHLAARLVVTTALFGILASSVSAQTLNSTYVMDQDVCGLLGCSAHAIEMIDRDIVQQQLGVDVFATTWSSASHCVRVSSSGPECESSVAVASDPAWNRIVWSRSDAFLKAYGTRGSVADGPGHFHMPLGVDITHRSGSANAHVAFVADALNDRIVVLLLEDHFLQQITWLV